MHNEILTASQEKILPLLRAFSKDFGLVGGTAIALYLGHRKSVDFDLFTSKKINASLIRKKIIHHYHITRILVDTADEYSVMVNGVKLTFLSYPFLIRFSNNAFGYIKIPTLLTLAAMKAYTLSRRSKWKDYVDLYAIFKHGVTNQKIIRKAKSIFKHEFNEKNFRVALSYFRDIDFSEEIIFLKKQKFSRNEIKKTLEKMSIGD